MINQLTTFTVWLRRIGHCRGFGIQSPFDYWLVRYVINEHWPYYQYAELGQNDDKLTRKLGKLYFRLANWRQPELIMSNGFQSYFKAGCNRAKVVTEVNRLELGRLALEGNYRQMMSSIYNKVDNNSVLVVEHIWQDMGFWNELVADERTGVTFDLYYCGLVFFDKSRHKQNYIINF